jgi:EAL domain-containing protein (putative c-di-GMP-specific phosphodiesterase class I)
LQQTGLAPEHLELEITESVAMENAEQAIATLNSFKAMGIAMSIDDFGTGYSSLSYLKRFPIDTLKIDRSFVKDIPGDKDDAAITTATIAMAHSLKLKVIAEGVETVEQITFLQQHNCDEAQGYYFSKPVTAEEAAKMLQQAVLFVPLVCSFDI